MIYIWFSKVDKEKFRQANSPPNGRGVQSNGLDSLPRCNQFLTRVSTILIIIRHGNRIQHNPANTTQSPILVMLLKIAHTRPIQNTLTLSSWEEAPVS